MLPKPISQWRRFVKGRGDNSGRGRARTEVTEEGKGDGTGQMLGDLQALNADFRRRAHTRLPQSNKITPTPGLLFERPPFSKTSE
jgi:hypothetical protein